MLIRTLILSCFLLFCSAPLFARDNTDLLIMKNGDHMTCQIKGLDSGVLYVSFDYIDGTASVDWSKVARVESKQLFVVKTEDGSTYTGTLHSVETPAGRPVQIQVVETPAMIKTVDRVRIVTMVGTSDAFWQRFSGQIGFGVNYSKGNQATQYTLGSQTAYVRERWNAQANYSSNLASSTGSSSSTRNELIGLYEHLAPWENWYYGGIGDVLQSSVEGISLQSTLGGGMGRYVSRTNRTDISLLGGAVWQSTKYQPSVVSTNARNLAGALVYANAQFFRFSKTNLGVTALVIPALSDPGRIRFDTNATYYVKLIGNLKWNTTFYGTWDNRPPPGFSGSDYGTNSSLSWSFGLK